MYISKTELKQYTGLNWTSGLDTFVDTVISGAQKYIERYCGDEKLGLRKFEAPSPDNDETRKFDGSGGKRLYFGDLFSLTSLTDDGTLLTIDDDFYLYPLNGDDAWQYAELSQPETRVDSNSREISSAPYIFEKAQASIVVIGKFYFSLVPPDDIKIACMKLASAMLKENITDADTKELKSEQLGEYKATYQDVSKIAHQLKVNQILAPYVRKTNSGSVGRILVS